MTDRESTTNFLTLIWAPILTLVGILVAVCLFLLFQNSVIAAPLADFDKMEVSDGFHHISVASGQHWDVSYEQSHDRVFEGVVRHTSMDHLTNFPIISFDILVTSGDFSSPVLVSTTVEDHHFTWQGLTDIPPQGTINLLHTVPKNQAIEDDLQRIKDGDHVTIRGWDILKIDGYAKNGAYVGYWEDSGCNTTLVTAVTIQ